MNITRKLTDHEHAQANVVIQDSITIPQVIDIALISYITTVIWVSIDCYTKTVFVQCTGLYSRTTIKHIGWFCREYLNCSYYDIKEIAGTGEVIELPCYEHLMSKICMRKVRA